tara:strand:- start:102 stop:476 length:375 start_codon:yes stop_codon:yes gene_type:complete
MALKKKENREGKEVVETSSNLDEKHQYILDELSELMEKAGDGYGPFLMEELKGRLEFVIQNFNEEVKTLIKSSFEKWEIKNSQVRDLIAGNVQVSSSQQATEKSEDSSTPDFIKGIEFGPIRSK